VTLADRRVHASAPGIEVVRYDKAGKWYVEIAANYGRPGLLAERIHVSVTEAAEAARNIARRPSGEVHLGLHGGTTFDRLVTL